MINDLVSKLKDRHYSDLTAKGRLVCPDCGAQATEPPDVGASSMQCPRCRTTALLEEWSRAGRDGVMVGDADSPPPDTKIVRNQSSGTTTWQIPASGQGCFFLFFAGFWLSITALISLPIFYSLITKPIKPLGDFPLWASVPFLVAFLGLFWAVGLGVLYAGLRARYARHLLTVDGAALTLRRELFGRASEKSIALDEVMRVVQKEFYQQNYKPVFGIEIEGRRSKLRFGSTLTDGEKAWLVADLRRAVAQPDDILPPMAAQQGTIAAASPPGRPLSFSFVLESPARIMQVQAFVALAAGLAFFGVGVFIIPLFGSLPKGGFGVADAFGIIWLLISAGMVYSGASMVLFMLRNRRTEIHIAGDETNVSVRTMKDGRALQEKWYPRNEITTVRAIARGQAGSTEIKQLVLLMGGKKVEIAKWVPAMEADKVVRGMNAALETGKNGG